MHSAAGDALGGVAYLLCRRRRNARRLEATINFRISHRSRSINWKLISHIVGRPTDSPSICGRVAPTNTETAWQCLASGRAPSSRWYVSSGLASACLQETHTNGKKTSISTDRPINQRATPINSSEPVYTTDNATQLSVVFCFIVPRREEAYRNSYQRTALNALRPKTFAITRISHAYVLDNTIWFIGYYTRCIQATCCPELNAL